MSTRKKGRKLRVFILLLCLVVLAVYGGMKSGEYLANKLSKPIAEGNDNVFKDAKVEGNDGETIAIAEDEMVALTAVVTEFITAEHMKKNDRISYLTHPDYFSTLLKEIKNISSGEAKIQDISYKTIDSRKAVAEVVSLKGSKRITEELTLGKEDSTWKITKVSR